MLTKAEQAFLGYDMKNAFSLFSYLAEQGNGRACYFLGEIYINNYGGVAKKDYKEAEKWRKIGAERDDILSRLNCAYSTEDENEKKAIFSSVFDDVLALAQQGDVYAMNEVADMFNNGYGTKEDKGKGRYWLEESANKGYWRSLNKLGFLFDNEGQHEQAFSYYKKSADIGYEAALYNTANCYADGKGVEENFSKALEYYTASAQKGFAPAQNMVGSSYDWNASKFGREKNVAEAEKWFKLSGENGEEVGFWNLALVLNNKEYYSGKDEEILKYLMKAADLGYEKAVIEVAVRLCSGKGVSWEMKDEYGKMEYKDDSLIGGMIEVFTTKDWREGEIKEKGKAILTEYAEKGNRAAQYYLGMMYADNSCLGKDKDIAQKWLRKAKEQGLKVAEEALNQTYEKVSLIERPLFGSWHAGLLRYFIT